MKTFRLRGLRRLHIVDAGFCRHTSSTDEEAKSATAAAAAWGCEGGKWEKETEATGVYELDDAKCKDGRNYDLKFDKDFKLIDITAD